MITEDRRAKRSAVGKNEREAVVDANRLRGISIDREVVSIAVTYIIQLLMLSYVFVLPEVTASAWLSVSIITYYVRKTAAHCGSNFKKPPKLKDRTSYRIHTDKTGLTLFSYTRFLFDDSSQAISLD